jgi:hypothetical protein
LIVIDNEAHIPSSNIDLSVDSKYILIKSRAFIDIEPSEIPLDVIDPSIIIHFKLVGFPFIYNGIFLAL